MNKFCFLVDILINADKEIRTKCNKIIIIKSFADQNLAYISINSGNF